MPSLASPVPAPRHRPAPRSGLGREGLVQLVSAYHINGLGLALSGGLLLLRRLVASDMLLLLYTQAIGPSSETSPTRGRSMTFGPSATAAGVPGGGGAETWSCLVVPPVACRRRSVPGVSGKESASVQMPALTAAMHPPPPLVVPHPREDGPPPPPGGRSPSDGPPPPPGGPHHHHTSTFAGTEIAA